jgi:Kef-type K+ transport system membrane component KefB
MLTIREEIELHRLRELQRTHVLGAAFALVAAIMFFIGSLGRPPFPPFLLFAALLLALAIAFIAGAVRASRRIQRLEQFT